MCWWQARSSSPADLSSSSSLSLRDTTRSSAMLSRSWPSGLAGRHKTMAVKPQDLMVPGATDYQYGFHDVEDYKFKSGRGLTREMVAQISGMKNEPQWMLDFRLKAYEIFMRKPMPT